MQPRLEDLAYQRDAVRSVVGVFQGQPRNTFDTACRDGVRGNVLHLSPRRIRDNLLAVIRENGIDPRVACVQDTPDFCVEMETGTGKTLVYLKTMCELHREFGFTKFIVLVPSIAVKEGVLAAFADFQQQLARIHGTVPACFDYDGRRLNRVIRFVEEQHPQIMVMTLQAFNTHDRILNQAKREDLFCRMPFLQAIAQTRPVVVMDEPQEGMDTPNAVARIAALRPLCKLRYSATHKVVTNLLYRLTPFACYSQGLVKKIEVLTVAEQNQEADLRVELVGAKTYPDGKPPRAKLRLWYVRKNGGFALRESPFLGVGADLQRETGNVIYRGYVLRRVFKPLREPTYRCEFDNGAMILENAKSGDVRGIFGEQLYWLIDSHFAKRERLRARGVKGLSLIFIDRVANYVRPDGIIRELFARKYQEVCRRRLRREATPEEITAAQGYYFAQTPKGEFSDSERLMRGDKRLFDLILRHKQELLRLENPVEFIFTHSALGVGWDNPNVFTIATLNQSHSEIKKRQEIGRGLRICVNQQGERVYDPPDCAPGDEINLLTIVPNETYATFAAQYQSEISEVYGDAVSAADGDAADYGAQLRHKVKGDYPSKRCARRNDAVYHSRSFRAFWRRLSRRTDYTFVIDDEAVIAQAVPVLDTLKIEPYEVEAALHRVRQLGQDGLDDVYLGSEQHRLRPVMQPVDLVKEIGDNTSLSCRSVLRIIRAMTNHRAIIANPARFVHEASARIQRIMRQELLRGLCYRPSGEAFDLARLPPDVVTFADTVATPKRGVYDRVICDSELERDFALRAEHDDEVVCFLKLPAFYQIPTPIGPYTPDFGVVFRRKRLREGNEQEFYFVVETKGTNDLGDTKTLRPDEVYKIRCAMKHFDALGIDARIHYDAPVKEYSVFKSRAKGVMRD